MTLQEGPVTFILCLCLHLAKLISRGNLQFSQKAPDMVKYEYCCVAFPDAFPRYEVAIISSDNDAYNAWLVARKNVAIPFQSINPVIDPGSPVRLSTSSRLWDPEYDISSSSSLNPLELNSWHHLTRWTAGGGREGGLLRILAPAAFPFYFCLPN